MAPRSPDHKLVVASDLFLDLKLYQIPLWVLKQLHEQFPFLELVEVNTPRTEGEPLPAEAEVYWGSRITPLTVAGLPRLRWLHFASVGVDRALLPGVRHPDLIVTNSRGIVGPAMAASALGFILALARGFHHSWSHRQAGIFGRQAFDEHFEALGDLEGQSVLIVGYGYVGARLGRACRALGMRVFGIRRGPAEQTDDVEAFYTLDELPERVVDMDFVVDVLPFTPQTRNAFSAGVFERMAASSYFVNVGRGETVDEPALIETLKAGRIAGAGLDVHSKLPLPRDSPLFELDNVILTPHVAGLTKSYWPRASQLFRTNVERYLNHEPLLNLVDLERQY